MKKALVAICISLSLLVFIVLAVVLIRTALFKSRQVQMEPAQDVIINGKKAADHLAHSIRFQTISFQDRSQMNGEEFLAFHQYLEKTFPQVHSSLQKEIIGNFSLLYTWKGQNTDLKPILLAAHMDVVPIELGTESEWMHPPFEGRIADGFIWGRGAMDDKASLLGILEAVEWLLLQGFQPQRTICLAFGHDEEIGGMEGASKVVSHLHSRGVDLEYVNDEGLVIVNGIMPGVTQPVALVGIAEKGFLSIELIAGDEGGHSSMPSQKTVIGILSTAIHKLEANQMTAKFAAPVKQTFDYVGPEMKFLMRMVFANRWLFGGMIKKKLTSSPATNATIRTITAATVFQGGIKENVLPKKARAVVNFRILTGESISSVIEHVRQTIDDPRIKIRPLESFFMEPSPVSDTDSLNFNIFQQTICQVFPGVIIAPGLTLGASDSRHYAKLSKDIYRFCPMRLGPDDLSRIHGTNERISLENYEEIIKFYIQLIRNSTDMSSRGN